MEDALLEAVASFAVMLLSKLLTMKKEKRQAQAPVAYIMVLIILNSEALSLKPEA